MGSHVIVFIQACPEAALKTRRRLLLPGHQSHSWAASNRTAQFSTFQSGMSTEPIYHLQPIPADPPSPLNSDLQNQNEGRLPTPLRSTHSPGSSLKSAKARDRPCSDSQILLLALIKNFISYHGIFLGKYLFFYLVFSSHLPKIERVAECF